MSTAQQGRNQSSPSTWTEPPWLGWIETTHDALLILEAARRGLIPRVIRRLVDSERKMITSGSVFVFRQDESGIKRWADGFSWSPSRIVGNFFVYREVDNWGAGRCGDSCKLKTDGLVKKVWATFRVMTHLLIKYLDFYFSYRRHHSTGNFILQDQRC